MIFDYEMLRLIWWLLLGALLIGFAITGGFDLGVAMLLLAFGKNDTERRVIINSIGPTWEGNQVWFVTAGGALFAAWPMAYSVSFSGFYFALLLTLAALFLRPIGFDYRSKLPSAIWRRNWDIALFIGGLVPSLIFGVAFGNLLQGVPFHFDNDMRIYYDGTFWGLLNPFGITAGLVSIGMLLMHGAVYLQIKTEGAIYQRCKQAVPVFMLITLGIFGVAGFWIAHIDGYLISSELMPNGPSNPLLKTVQKSPGEWLMIYSQNPNLWMIPFNALIAGAFTWIFSKTDRPGLAFISSSVMLSAIILTAGVTMFPFLIPSSTTPNHSLTIWDASSSESTLKIMLVVTLVFLPIIVAYTSWVFSVLRGKITDTHIQQHDHTAY